MRMKVKKMRKHSIKFISLFTALFLWMYVQNSETVKFEKTVGLEFILPSDMVFAETPVQEVVFMIEGPRAFVRNVSEREDKLLIDLNKAGAKKQQSFGIDIVPTQLSLPFGMVVERVLPRKINIKLEKKARKTVPLKPRFVGNLPEGLSISRSEMSPKEIEIWGPQSLVKNIKEISTAPIDKETLIGGNSMNVELIQRDDRVVYEIYQPPKLNYQLKATKANLILRDLPIRYLTQNKKAKANTSTATIRLLVPESMIERGNAAISSSIQVWADIPTQTEGRVEANLRAILPPGVHLVDISPRSIIVNLD